MAFASASCAGKPGPGDHSLPDAAELQHPYADRKPNEEVAENADLDVASSVRRPAGAGRLFKKPTPESALRP